MPQAVSGSVDLGFRQIPQRAICVVVLLVSLMLLTGCRALQVDHPQAVRSSDWLTEAGSSRRGGVLSASLRPPLTTAWVADADAGFGPASPLLLGDVVLVPTRKGEVVGFDVRTGERLGREGFGEAIEGTPVVADGMLVVPVEWGRRALVGYDLRRARRVWGHKGEPVHAGLAEQGGQVVAADLRGTVRSVMATDGEEVWSAEGTGAGVYGAPLIAEELVVVADERGLVRAFSIEDGQSVWHQEVGAPVLVTPAAAASRIVVSTTRGYLVALGLHGGGELWRFALPDSTARVTSPAVDGQHVYFSATDGFVRALEAATGHVVWETDVDEAVTAPPLLAGDLLYVATLGGRLLALDAASGEQRWQHELEARSKSPMAARDGRLVVLSEPNEVTMFTEDQDVLAAD